MIAGNQKNPPLPLRERVGTRGARAAARKNAYRYPSPGSLTLATLSHEGRGYRQNDGSV
jgi:hypothetical protein